MAISKIQYNDKVAINIDSTIPDINKCNASDLNEIKSVVNNNANEIPTKVSDLTNDSGYITKDVNDLTNYTKTSDLSSVATSGSYNDLIDTPTIPSISDEYGTSTTNGYSQNYINTNTLNPSGEPSTSEEDVSNATFNNTLVAPMNIDLKGNTLQNGTPTPSSPIPVNNVSGDNNVVVCGKNLFDGQLELGNYDNQGNKLAENNIYRNANIILVKPNTTYTFSINGATQKYVLYYYDNTKTFISNTTSLTTGTFTTPANCYYINFRCFAADYTSNFASLKVQLEQGNQATTYEAYNGTTYNIDLPVENLFDKTAITENIRLSGTGEVINNNGFFTSDYIKVSPNTKYTITCLSVSPYWLDVYQYTNDKTWISRTYLNVGEIYNITTGANTYFIRFSSKITSIDTAQVELGIKANKHTPYGTTPIELNKIGTYQDYFYKDNNKWYLHKEIGKVVLNGSESDSDYNTGTTGNFTRFGYHPFMDTNVVKVQSDYVSNYFKYLGTIGGDTTEAGISNTNVANLNRLFIFLPTSTASTISAFKTWLTTHNTTIYYVLATPTNTEITYTPLIEQLESIKNAMSKEGTTNVNQVNNDAPFILDLSVFNDTYNGRYESLDNQVQINTSDISKLQETNIYDDTERVIGTFMGKPLYRKVIQFTTNSATYNHTTDILKSNIDNIYINGNSFAEDVYSSIPINSVNANDNSYTTGAFIDKSTTYITFKIRNGSNRSALNYTIIVEYTKTTD